MQGSFQVIAAYQMSMCEPDTIQYFLYNFKNSLNVFGDSNHDYMCRDVRAEWLGLPSDFRGTMGVNPQQKQLGFTVMYSQDLKRFAEYDFLKRFWLNIAVPIVVIENNMNLTQWGVQNVADVCPKDIVSAFNQSCWRFGKINGRMSRLNVAPIYIQLGGAFLDDGPNQVVSYSTLLIPSGQEDEGKYMFEPVAGYNGHLAFGTGVNFQFGLNRDNERFDVCFYLNLEGVFLIRNWHYRTFDLKCKPWSRYLLLTRPGAMPGQYEPAVNIFTQRVKVRPYNVVDFAIGFRVKSESFELEAGYSIWGHGSERIECLHKFDCNFGIAGPILPGDTKARSACLSTICQQKATPDELLPENQNPKFCCVGAADLDVHSAEAPGALNHKAHLAGGFEHKGQRVDAFVGVGAFYEIPQKNSALKMWGVWLKLGGSF